MRKRNDGRHQRSIVRRLAQAVTILLCLVAVTSVAVSIAATPKARIANTTAGWPPEKAARWAAQQRTIASAQAYTRAHRSEVLKQKAALARLPRPTDPPQPPRQPGIVEGVHGGPFPGGEFTGENFWQGGVGRVWVQVYAGGKPAWAGGYPDGALRLYTLPVDPNDGNIPTFVGSFAAPPSVPRLSIKGVTGTVLAVSAADGTKLTFDLVTHAFSR